ncbi:MAG: type II secretion system F family protein, partial [Planctomycetota bacterium]|nr:type II secretion system F family protein [Planctomycetota bacterium]
TARAALGVAIAYPLAVWAVCLPVALFLVIFILPKFADILRALPPPGLAWWPPMTRVTTGIVYASSVLFLVPLIRVMSEPAATDPPSVSPLWRGCDALLRYIEGCLPLFRARLRQRSLARCARALGAMFESGMALPQACRHVAVPELAGPCAPAFARLAQATEEGRPLAEALRAARLPESFSALALAGAAGGEMALAMATAAEWHEARARRLDRIMATLLPCLTIPTTGLLVGCVYGGVFAAINAMRAAVIPPMPGVW